MLTTIKLTTLLLALFGLGMGIYEAIKGPQSQRWYKFYLIILFFLAIGSILTLDVFGFIIWVLILGFTYWRAKKMGIDLF
jgi:predicted MFS family arabinose efflux permease